MLTHVTSDQYMAFVCKELNDNFIFQIGPFLRYFPSKLNAVVTV